ncbi:unnamed protein product [Mytilus coruscus]|uniref:Uncharacterized protein n=1 Tax=Mytilus coruscus TaxID=42192 RepID=A0A6J8BZY8_MYTCO|nr:unnamed protein product [Mytilus coruscus]
MLVDGERQCACVALCFMVSVTHEPSTPSVVHHILQLGTDLYHSICTHRGYTLINEIPSTVDIAGRSLHFHVIESRGGSTARAVDDLDALCFSIRGALKRCCEESDMCFMTVGSYPSCTIEPSVEAGVDSQVKEQNAATSSEQSTPVTQFQQNTNDHCDHEENDDVPVDNINTKTQLSSAALVLCDLHDYDHNAPGEMKYRLYCQREPHISFKFPSKITRIKEGNLEILKDHVCGNGSPFSTSYHIPFIKVVSILCPAGCFRIHRIDDPSN